MDKSMWLDNTDIKTYTTVQKDMYVDVVIIGGTLTSIATAYSLLKAGYRVAILESDYLYSEENLNTNGNVTFQNGLKYKKLVDKIGLENTQLFVESKKIGMNTLLENIKELNVECTFDIVNQFIYTNKEENVGLIKEEYEITKKLSLDTFLTNKLNLPFDVKQSICFKNQGQFNISKYLIRLLWYLEKRDNVNIFEHAKIQSIFEDETGCTTNLLNGYVIKSKYIVVTSQFTLLDLTFPYYQNLIHYKTYNIAVDTIRHIEEGIYSSIDTPNISIRKHKYNDKEDLIILTKEDEENLIKNEEIHYDKLRSIGDNYFNINKQMYKWMCNDFKTNDGLPLIGRLIDKQNIFIATGFSCSGNINAHLAANVISDLISNNKSRYEALYNPNRTL